MGGLRCDYWGGQFIADIGESKRFFDYLLRCSDGSLYCGWTTDLERRLAAHNSGKGGAKYTRTRRWFELIYFGEVDNKILAMKREWQIKHVSRTEKLRLIEWKDIDMIMIKKFGYFPIMFEIETIPSTCEPQISKMIPPTTNDSIKLRCSTENLSRMNQPESNLNLQTYGLNLWQHFFSGK